MSSQISKSNKPDSSRLDPDAPQAKKKVAKPGNQKAATDKPAADAKQGAEVRRPARAKLDPESADKTPAKKAAKDGAGNGATAGNGAAKRKVAKSNPFTPGAAAPGEAAGAEMLPEEPSGGYRELFQKVSSWTFSVIVHMVILIILGLWALPALLEPDPPEIVALQEREDEMVVEVLDQQLTPSTEITAASSSASSLPTGHASQMQESKVTFEKAVSDTGPAVNVGPVMNIGAVSGDSLNMEVPDEAPGDPQAVVDSIDEAMDRITQEIVLMLQKSKVLVVWAFDESESMEDDRKEIRAKIDRVYQELGLIGATNGDALLTSIASYGAKPTTHTRKPTYDLNEIRSAIDRVPNDPSGEEQQCLAVGTLIQQHQSFAKQGRRQLALILVTDESGDQTTNVELLEPTIGMAKQARCKIYVLGREAVFGYPYALMRWQDAMTKLNYWLRIDRGPETPFVESLQTNGFWRRQDAHPSGFGPYEQCRMAYETGGVFFMLPSPEVNLVHRDDRKYALAKIRPYLPSLEPRQEYAMDRDQSHLRRVMWKVINDLNPYNPAQAPHINMRDNFSIEPVQFRQQALQEMEKAKRYVTYLDMAEKELEALADDRRKEVYPRWQANYDLMYAQVLAYKVRIYEYGAYLDFFLKNPKMPETKPPKPNLTLTNWDIRTRKETITGDLTKSYIEKSSELLNKIMKDHEGTPWATRAQWELGRGFGVHLMQEWDDPRRGVGVKLPKL